MPMTSSSPLSRKWLRLGLFLYATVVVIASLTVTDYGLSWDEHFRFQSADAKLEYYSELLAGEMPDPERSTYPGLFDLPLAIAHELFPDLGTRSQKGHVWSLCFGLLGLFSVWRLTAIIGGERAAFWAMLFLATLPRYFGHMFFNPKDIPLAGTYAFGCWALVALFARLPSVSWKSVAWVGFAAGLSMSCRVAGFLILCYFGLFVGVYLLLKYLKQKHSAFEILKDFRFWGLRGGASGLIAFAILFVFWPMLHSNPFGSMGASVEQAQNFGWSGSVLMDGHFWEAADLPIYYLPYWLFRTTPEHLILLLVVAVFLGLGWLFTSLRSRKWPEYGPLLSRLVLVFSGFFPIAYIMWKDPVLYDGMRHILFVIPSLVAVCALALEWCLRRVESAGRQAIAYILQAGVAASVALVVFNMWQLHPYQYVYFNSFSGGLEGAYNRDETDYWGLSHKEAGEWLNQFVKTFDTDAERIYKVHLRYSRWMIKEALDPNRLEVWQPREGADFFVSVTRFNLHTSYPEATLIHTVERQGVPLCFIFMFSDANALD